MEREPRFGDEGGFAARKVASQWRRWLRSGEGGFAAMNPRPLILGFLVR